MTRRIVILALSAWVGVVAAGSALTWLAIDRAGQQVTGDSAVIEMTPTPSPTARPSASPTKPVGKPTRTPTRTPAQPASTTVSRPTRPWSPPPVHPSPAPASQARTWSGTAGSLTVSCTGGLARFVAASPNNGWQVERSDSSGDSVEVKFSRSGTQVQVQASCVQGVPSFQAETSGGSDG